MSWDTRTRTRNDRTRICSVTITPYPNVFLLLQCHFLIASAKVILFSGSCKFFGKFLSKKDKKVYFCWWYPLFNVPLQQISGFSAVGSALRSGRRGRWFESSRAYQNVLMKDATPKTPHKSAAFSHIMHRF